MNLGAITSGLIKFGPTVMALVQGAKDKWGNSKTGPEKFKAVKDVILGSPTTPGAIPVVESALGKDLVNEANLATAADDIETLVNESIQLGYDIMKKRERLEEIGHMLTNLKGTGQPVS